MRTLTAAQLYCRLMYERGQSTHELARRLGKNRGQIQRLIKRAGGTLRSPSLAAKMRCERERQS